MAPPASPTLQELFSAARQQHQAGRLNDAERLYREALAIDPRHADCLHLLGVALGQTGRLDPAIELIREAIAINGNVASYHSNLGALLQNRGRPDEAVACLRHAIALRPELPEAHNNLGNALNTQGKLVDAAACFDRAIALRPDYPEAYNNLGDVLRRQGRFEEAEAQFHGAIALQPNYPEAHSNLGHLRLRQGRLAEATACFHRAIAAKPNNATAHNDLGDALKQLGQLDDALASFRRAIELRPDYPEAHNNIGVTLNEAGQNDAAAASFRHALDFRPDYPEAHYNLANALRRQGNTEAAEAHYRRAIALRPDFTEAHNNLGNALLRLGRPEEAAACCRAALAQKPYYADAHYNLGNALLKLWRLDEAVASFRRALELKPDFPEAHNNLGNALKEQGRLDEAITQYEQALRIRPDDFLAYYSLLFTQNYMANQPEEALLALARRFGALATARVGQAFDRWQEPAPGQPLRVGLVSGDFGNHPVGYFLEGLLRASDPSRIAFVAFPTQPDEDELTARIKPYLAEWRPIHDLDDAAAAGLIHASGIQVLLDLAGHTAHNRLPVFAWRPAAVQATWLGYFATTGVAEIDYIIGDPQVTPPGEAGRFTETVWRLPETYLCFTAPTIDVAVSELPARTSGSFTFGCFNNLNKINEAVVTVWARVLREVPNSRLVLKAFQLQDEAVRDAVRARFAAHGIRHDRLLTEPPSSRAAYLRDYHRIDIALDPFPYPGGTTTCEAFWMGVPVLTLRGNGFLSHAGETFARNAGLADWIAADEDEYVRLAVRLAADLENLAGLRARLRDQVLASPLFDAPRFAQYFETAMSGMWNRWSDKA